MYGQGIENAAIAESKEYSVYYVTELVTKYIEKGIETMVEDKGGSNNRRMSYEKEEEFLERFRERAEAGELLTIKEILVKFEEETGKPSATSTIYDLLKRHGWRKLKPRRENPRKASDEEIASSKKNSGKSTGYYWQKTEAEPRRTIM
jgi:transposase